MRHPLATKAALIAALVVLLMIPVGMIRGLVAERQARSQEAIAGIAEGWGKRQTVTSPYLAVPYERQWTAVKRETIDGKLREARTEHRELQVLRLPASNVQWTVDTTLAEKARGIYRARLYGAKIAASGKRPMAMTMACWIARRSEVKSGYSRGPQAPNPSFQRTSAAIRA